jgi:flagellar protein FliS
MNNPALYYRESAVRSASPVGLVAILYEEVIRSLRKAQRALRQGDIEQRTMELSHAIRVVGYLQSVLNFEQGGTVARNLSDFYNAARTAMLQANSDGGDSILESLAGDFANLTGAWRQVDQELGYSSYTESPGPVMQHIRASDFGVSSRHSGFER